MCYTVIDRDTWNREEFFAHYLSAVPCTYSMTVRLDITNLREKGLKLYPSMLYALTKTVNQFEQFRMAFRPDSTLVCYHSMTPSYTVFHRESETFSNLWTAYSEDYAVFLQNYTADQAQYGHLEGFAPKPDMPENIFTVSMVPWTDFTSFQINTPHFRYLPPIFTIGKFEQENGKWTLPLAAQVHHAVCDGFHLCRFLDRLQQELHAL